MAAAMINNAVAQALHMSQLETLENFKKYLAAKDDVDMEFMEELIGGFRTTLEAAKPKAVGKGKGGAGKKAAGGDEGGEKKKRAPSAYTMFIKHKMSLLKTEDPDIKSGKELMSKAVAAWSELSDDQKNALKNTLKEEPELTAEELYNKALV
jgi:hypothetical protein